MDHTQLEIVKKVNHVFCHICIDDWRSVAHFQHHSFGKWRYRDIQAKVKSVLYVTGAPLHKWLFLWIIYILSLI